MSEFPLLIAETLYYKSAALCCLEHARCLINMRVGLPTKIATAVVATRTAQQVSLLPHQSKSLGAMANDNSVDNDRVGDQHLYDLPLDAPQPAAQFAVSPTPWDVETLVTPCAVGDT